MYKNAMHCNANEIEDVRNYKLHPPWQSQNPLLDQRKENQILLVYNSSCRGSSSSSPALSAPPEYSLAVIGLTTD